MHFEWNRLHRTYILILCIECHILKCLKFWWPKDLRRNTVRDISNQQPAHLSFQYACLFVICTNNLLLRLVVIYAHIAQNEMFRWRRGLTKIWKTQCVNETCVNCNHFHVSTRHVMEMYVCIATADFFFAVRSFFFRFQSQTNNYYYYIQCMHEYCNRAKALWIIIITNHLPLMLFDEFRKFFILLWTFIGRYLPFGCNHSCYAPN